MTPTDLSWFHQARYGMFIHWGAYSVAARGEWAANRERIPLEEYSSLYAENFRAENYDPAHWAQLAKEAGMGYAVLTTRHHDGFALWPTRTHDFHAGRLGAKRDLVRPFVEAFRAAGLKVGFYFSPADWYHPDYPGPFHRDWPGAQDWKSEAARLRFIDYYRAQLRELLTEYGSIDYLWFDGCIPDNLQSQEANEEALRLQPSLLINERNGLPWHVKISEQAIKPAPPGIPWEACMTLNDSWGYHSGDHNWKSSLHIIQMLTKTAAGAGNLLLNVGPHPDGTIPGETIRLLRESGAWLKNHGASIHNSSRSPFTWNTWGNITTRENHVYLHIWNHPGPELCLAELKNKVLRAYWLHDNRPVPFEQKESRLFLRQLPEPNSRPGVQTIALEVEGLPEPITQQTSFWIPGE